MNYNLVSYDRFAEIYDTDMGMNIGLSDLELYTAYISKDGMKILELACGTGRLLKEFVKNDKNRVTGLDISEKMLEKAKEKLGNAANCHLVCRDMAEFDLGDKNFDLICIPFSSFTKLLTEKTQKSCLRNCFLHLKPGGRLLIDLFVPDYQLLADNSQAFKYDYTRKKGQDTTLSRHKRLIQCHSRQITDVVLQYEEFNSDGVTKRFELQDKIRYVFKNEMKYLLELAGFTVEEILGGYDRVPYNYYSKKMIFVAKKARKGIIEDAI